MLALVVPKGPKAPARPRLGPSRKRRGSSGKGGRPRRPRKLPPQRQGRPPQTPPQPGAPDRTFELLGLLRTPVLAAALVVLQLLRDWQQLNSRKRDPAAGPVGPFITLEVGPGAGLAPFFYQRQAQTLRGLSAIQQGRPDGYSTDTGWEYVGGLGILPVARMVLVGSDTTGVPADAEPSEQLAGFNGLRWQLLDPDGESLGELEVGDRFTRTDSPDGTFFLTGQRTEVQVVNLQGEFLTLPTDFQVPEPVPGSVPEPEPLEEAPGIAEPATAPVPLPLAVPGAVPVPGSTPQPGSLGAGQRFTPALPAAGGTAVRPQAVPENAQALTPQGQPSRPPAPPVVPTNPRSTFLPGGTELPPNGPRPAPQNMAREMGNLERKLELMLDKDSPLSPLELLNKVIDQIENIEFLLEKLFPQGPYEFGAGAYQLAPVCDRDSEGNLIGPLEAPWPGGQGELTELRQKLDALAQLLQHHKNLKQPTCGGRGSGAPGNVTVHFESD